MSYLESKSGSISEVVKEMQKHIKDNAYQDMFKKELEKTGKGIGAMSDMEKKQITAGGKMMTWDLYTKLGHDDAPNWMTYVNSKKNEIIDLPQSFKDAAKKATDEWAEETGKKANDWFRKIWASQNAYKDAWSQAHRYR